MRPASQEEPRRSAHALLHRRGAAFIAATGGGHLGQALRLSSELRFPTRLVTTASAAGLASHPPAALLPDPRGLKGWTKNAAASFVLAARFRPRLVIALGSGGVAFFSLWSRFFGARLVVCESFARVRTPSRFAKFLSLAASDVLVQWPELGTQLPRTTLVRPIYDLHSPGGHQLSRVLVAVGTYHGGMNRLLRMVDTLELPDVTKVVSQVGHSSYLPKKGTWFRWKSPKDFEDEIGAADLIITHDGASTIAQCLQRGKRVIVVPREASELDYASTQELATKLADTGWILIAHDQSQLQRALTQILDIKPKALCDGVGAAEHLGASEDDTLIDGTSNATPRS